MQIAPGDTSILLCLFLLIFTVEKLVFVVSKSLFFAYIRQTNFYADCKSSPRIKKRTPRSKVVIQISAYHFWGPILSAPLSLSLFLTLSGRYLTALRRRFIPREAYPGARQAANCTFYGHQNIVHWPGIIEPDAYWPQRFEPYGITV